MKTVLRNRKSVNARGVLCLLIFLTVCSVVWAQSSNYRIQSSDRISFTFWEYPELNTTTTVSREGEVELPIIGRMRVSGLSVEELRNSIISKMAIYNKLVNQLNITVEEYGQNIVYVTGQVVNPGKFSFEEIPNLWNIILEAGGPLETATLDNVSIVRSDGNGQVLTVNLAYALQNGKLSELPKIRPRDTVNITGMTITGDTPSPLATKEEVFIIGAVRNPGSHRFEANMNLLEAVGRAGGPTENADLKKTTYVVVDEGQSRIIKLNLKEFMVDGAPRPLPVLRKGSTLYIPDKGKPSQFLTVVLSSLITAGITGTIYAVTR